LTDTSARPAEAPTPPDPRGEVVGLDWKLALLTAGFIALGVFGGLGWIVIISAIVVMIFLHELGHYLTAKWSGMKVTEFFLFFGPKIWSFRRGETEYGIKCIPLGAYVRIVGMSNLETDVPPEEEHRTYRQQSYPKRLLVVSAGSIMHLLQALVLFFIVFSVLGVSGGGELAERLGGPVPPADSWTIGSVTRGSAADRAGLREGDEVVSIAGDAVNTFNDVGGAVSDRAGDPVTIEVMRDDRRVALDATLDAREARVDEGEDPDKEYGFLGISPTYPELPRHRVSPVRGASEAVQVTAEAMGQTVSGLASFFTGGVDDFAADVAEGGSAPEPRPTASAPAQRVEDDEQRLLSIFGIARLGADIFDEDLANGLLLMAGVNISIGLLNMIPLLPLDGGHVALATYERIRSIGRRQRYMADVSRLLPITYAVVAFMLLLGVSAIYLDVVDPIG
jgi:membrane-associated protease RseP (regulator of RpoE activity)